jgi:hypothetical protein
VIQAEHGAEATSLESGTLINISLCVDGFLEENADEEKH